MKLSLKNLLQNKIVLYVVLFISVTSMFSYLMAQNYAPVLFFITIAFLTNYFSKNMIVVLGIAVLSTNMLTSTTNVFSHRGFREGLKGNDDSEDNEDNEDSEDSEDNKNSKDEELVKGIELEIAEAKTETKKLEKNISKKIGCNKFKNQSDCKNNDDCKWDNGKNICQSKSGFQNLNPASYPNANKSKPNLNEAGTIEAAYDNLENIMGSDSIRSMTADTQKLADRQKELIDQLKNIAPLIGQTTKMISSFNMDGKLQGMIDGLTKNISSINTSDPEGAKDAIN